MTGDFASIYRLFREAGIDETSPDSEKLISLFSIGEKCPECSSIMNNDLDFKMVAKKRKEGVPLEYALGVAQFMDHLFYCTTDTLIPRADTSLLVETAVSAVKELQGRGRKEVRIIEIGTGCGNIAVMVASLSKDTIIHASDISPDAVKVAGKNVELYGLGDRIRLKVGDMFEPFRKEEALDVVICNPPYIPSGSLQNLGREILDHEPVLALDAGTYGIDIFRRLIRDSLDFLRPGGVLAFEFGERQEKIVNRLLEKSGRYRDICFHEYQKIPRAVSAAKKTD